jgi:hypothetical protein
MPMTAARVARTSRIAREGPLFFLLEADIVLIGIHSLLAIRIGIMGPDTAGIDLSLFEG